MTVYRAWHEAAEQGDWLAAAKLSVLDQFAPSGIAQTFATIALAERLVGSDREPFFDADAAPKITMYTRAPVEG